MSARTNLDRRPQPGWVLRRELAEQLGVTMQTITGWERQGMPIAQRGKVPYPSWYDPIVVKTWLQAREARKQVGHHTDLPFERARLAREQADKTALLNRKLRSELCEMSVVRARNAEKIAACRERFLSLPGELVQQGLVLADHERRVVELVREALAELIGMDGHPGPDVVASRQQGAA